MTSTIRRTGAIAGALAAVLAVALLFFVPDAAYAASDASAVTAVSASATDLRDTLVSIATAVLPYAAAIVAILIGWRLARRFVRA